MASKDEEHRREEVSADSEEEEVASEEVSEEEAEDEVDLRQEGIFREDVERDFCYKEKEGRIKSFRI